MFFLFSYSSLALINTKSKNAKVLTYFYQLRPPKYRSIIKSKFNWKRERPQVNAQLIHIFELRISVLIKRTITVKYTGTSFIRPKLLFLPPIHVYPVF